MPTPEFILRLREKIGHDPLWLTGVSAIVLAPIDGAEHVLLGRRSDNGLWAGIYGILEPGEEPAVAAAREVLEETGVRVRIEALVAVKSDPELKTYPNGDQAHYLDLTFLAVPEAGVHEDLRRAARVADDESTEVAWFPVDQLPSPVSPTLTERLGKVLAFRRNPTAAAFFER